jgi:outer membrane protein, heavy metal efflux system
MRTLLANLALTLLLAGCAQQVERAQIEQWKRGELATRLEPARAQQAETAALPPGATVDDYVAAALQHNPMLAAARAKVRMLAERVPQVTSLEDPMIEVAPLWRGGDGSPAEVMVGVSQELPFPGKLGTRGQIAASQATQAGAELAAARLEVINDTRRAYWMHYAAQRGIEVTQETRGLLEQFRASADAAVRAGRAGQADVLRASVELDNLDNELSKLRQEQTSAAAMLNQLMNRPADAALPVPAEVDPPAQQAEIDQAIARAHAASPSVARLQERVRETQLEKTRAKQEWLPDFRVGAFYGFMGLNGEDEMEEDDEWWLTVGMTIPLWSEKRRAMEREASYAGQMALAELSDERNKLAFRVQDALARVTSQQRQVRLFRDRILPEARQTVDASAAAYRAGTTTFIELIDNWQQLLEYRLMYHRNVAELQQSLADLDAAMGVAPETPRSVNNQQD